MQDPSRGEAPSPKSDGSAASRHDNDANSPSDSAPGRAASQQSLLRRLSSSRGDAEATRTQMRKTQKEILANLQTLIDKK